MVENFNVHDAILAYLIKNDKEDPFLELLQKESYFFITRKVEPSNLKIMKRRRKAMLQYPHYQNTVSTLIDYFEKGKDSLVLGEFILKNRCYYIFYCFDDKKIVNQYDTPFLTIDKILKLNSEYELKGIGKIIYEIKKPRR